MTNQAAFSADCALGGRRAGPDAPTLPVPRTTAGPQSRFLFRFTARHGWVFPSGFASSGLLAGVPGGERCAVGGAVILDADHVEARFASCSSDAVRDAVVQHLRRWERESRWTVTIADGLHPVNPFPGEWNRLACHVCGRRGDVCATSMPYARTRAWVRLPCRCGGTFLPS